MPPSPSPPPGKRYYLFGYPIAHSAAPRFHNVCFDSEGIDSRYELWSTSRVTQEMIEVMKRDETGGAAVTMPLKSDITAYLDEVTTESFITGACNTVVKTKTQKNGGRVRLVGTNTDFLGIRNSLVSALRSQHPSLPIGLNHRYPAGRCSGAVIGGGATTRSAVYALWTLGMNPIFIVNRDSTEAEAIKRNFEGLKEVERLEIVHLRSTEEVDMWLGGGEGGGRARAPGVAMIVGAIPAIHPVTLSERLVYAIVTHILTLSGVFPSASALVHSETPLDPQGSPDPQGPHDPHGPHDSRLALPLPTRRIFLEMPYKPRLTPLLQIATALGWHPVGGINAMIEQGLAQQRMWRAGDASLETGCSDLLDPETERRAREMIVDMEDLVPLDPEIDRGLKTKM